MNWLTHILLSKRNTEYQLGNFLADPLKGKAWAGASEPFKEGMEMHKYIDAFTDSHPIVSQSKSRLGKGYLKGVVIDLLYDHYLSIKWTNYANDNQTTFLKCFYSNALSISKGYPSEPNLIITQLIKSNRLAKYKNFDDFIDVLKRVDSRLSSRIKAKDSTLRYINVIESEYQNILFDFELFFPELITFFKSHKLGSNTDNFLLNT